MSGASSSSHLNVLVSMVMCSSSELGFISSSSFLSDLPGGGEKMRQDRTGDEEEEQLGRGPMSSTEALQNIFTPQRPEPERRRPGGRKSRGGGRVEERFRQQSLLLRSRSILHHDETNAPPSTKRRRLISTSAPPSRQSSTHNRLPHWGDKLPLKGHYVSFCK